jgi:hypothetical protein
MTPKHQPSPPMTLGNMRELGVRHLIAYCQNGACCNPARYERGLQRNRGQER